jgi:hypothetical protein
MLVSRKWRLVALLALLVVGASLVVSLWAHGDASLIAALLPTFLAVLISFACAFPFSSWQLPFFPQLARASCGCRAPPIGLPRA